MDSLIDERCQHILLDVGIFNDMDCVLLVLSKLLGYSVMVMCLILKVPQLFSILSKKSVAGLSEFAFLLELYSYMSGFLYGYVQRFPFSTYGELAFLTLQDILIMMCFVVFSYDKNVVMTVVVIITLISFIYMALFTTVIPLVVVETMQSVSIPISAASKIAQITTIFRNGGTGVLSGATQGMALYGCVVRMLTTWTEVDDPMVMLAYSSSAFLNAILLMQIFYYYYYGGTGYGANASTSRMKKQN